MEMTTCDADHYHVFSVLKIIEITLSSASTTQFSLPTIITGSTSYLAINGVL